MRPGSHGPGNIVRLTYPAERVELYEPVRAAFLVVPYACPDGSLGDTVYADAFRPQADREIGG